MNKLSYDYKKYKFPEDWNEYKIKDVIELIERPVDMEDEESYRLVTVRRNYGGIDLRDIKKGYEISVKNQHLLKEGDFLISKRQISHGAFGLVPSELDGCIVSNEYNIFNGKKDISLEFLNLYCQLPFMKRYFYISSDGVHIEKLLFKTADWMNRNICIPTYDEQVKIVDTIKLMDKSIKIKEDLIDLKIKQNNSLKQNIVTGRVRLSGFNNELESIELKDVISFIKREPLEDPYNYNLATVKLHLKGVEGTNKKPKKTENGRPYYLREPGELLIGRQNFHNGGIGIVPNEMKNYIASNAISSAKSKYGNLRYYYYYMSNPNFYKRIGHLIGGTGQKEVPESMLNKQQMKITKNIEEQNKIVEILDTAMYELNLLEKELKALKEQRRWMIQNLLTGKVRAI